MSPVSPPLTVTAPATQPATLTLNLPHDLGLHVTLEQFVILAENNRELRLERTSQGELFVNPPTGWETGARNWNISGELYLWWRSAGEPGMAFDSSTGFTLPNGAVLSPDASWVSADRWEALTEEQRGIFAAVCPDFVVELRSRSDSLKPLQTKMREYLENGAKLGWLLDPQSRQVEIYRADRDVEILENPATLSGEHILDGFTLDLRRVWG